MVCFSSCLAQEGEDLEQEGGGAQAIIYTPHGISPANIQPLTTPSPKINTLALLHGLQDLKLGTQLNMGAHNGLKVQRILGAKYWIGTHDEVKRGGGLVSWFLDRKMITLKEAVEREKKERKRWELEGRRVRGARGCEVWGGGEWEDFGS
jgi:hypothetical protein